MLRDACRECQAINAELLDELLDGQDRPKVLRSDGLLGDLKKALAEQILNTGMDMLSSLVQASTVTQNSTNEESPLNRRLYLASPRDLYHCLAKSCAGKLN